MATFYEIKEIEFVCGTAIDDCIETLVRHAKALQGRFDVRTNVNGCKLQASSILFGTDEQFIEDQIQREIKLLKDQYQAHLEHWSNPNNLRGTD